MVIDDAPSVPTEPKPFNLDDLPKGPKGKKVCYVHLMNSDCPHLPCHDWSHYFLQVIESRPEVRFLDYQDIPGLIIENHHLRKIQKIATSSKKVKYTHLSASHGPHNFRPCESSYTAKHFLPSFNPQ